LTGSNGSLLPIVRTNSHAGSVNKTRSQTPKSCTWFFSLDVRVKTDCAYVPPSKFLEAFHSEKCLKTQRDKLRAAKDTSVISFSIDTDTGSVFFWGNVPFTQIEWFISTAKHMCKTVVQDWLGHIDIVNLKLTTIGFQRTHEQI
jgi:hypothetical protein